MVTSGRLRLKVRLIFSNCMRFFFLEIKYVNAEKSGKLDFPLFIFNIFFGSKTCKLASKIEGKKRVTFKKWPHVKADLLC